MTRRKNQNSVLFLTTLGVYLGLVVVGATPQVLAQAATTRSFCISEEAGQYGNLDGDPSKRRSRSVAIKIRRSVSAFFAEFSNAHICGASSEPLEPRCYVELGETVTAPKPPPIKSSLAKVLSPHHLARASI